MITQYKASFHPGDEETKVAFELIFKVVNKDIFDAMTEDEKVNALKMIESFETFLSNFKLNLQPPPTLTITKNYNYGTGINLNG